MTTYAKRRAQVAAELRPQVTLFAIGHLKTARVELRACGSRRAADYVARAIKSAQGALHHSERMVQR